MEEPYSKLKKYPLNNGPPAELHKYYEADEIRVTLLKYQRKKCFITVTLFRNSSPNHISLHLAHRWKDETNPDWSVKIFSLKVEVWHINDFIRIKTEFSELLERNQEIKPFALLSFN